MSRCNVDIYDHSLNLIFNDSIDTPDIDEDYLSPSESVIVIGKILDVPTNGFIFIDTPYNFLGCITSVDKQDYTVEIRFQPFITMFSQSVLFDTNMQKKPQGTSLEQYISNIITRYWISTADSDSLQNLSFLRTNVQTNTTNWTFDLKSDSDGQHYCIINLYDVVIIEALKKYGIVLSARFDRRYNRVYIDIFKNSGTFSINTNLNDVKIVSFKVNDFGSVTNKLEIWNSSNYSSNNVIYYYLHPDGSYNTNNTNRIEPVRMNVISIDPGEDSFASAAADQAESEFGSVEPETNIELEVARTDTLIDPENLPFGKTVVLYNNEYAYTVLLTGKRHSGVMTLMFGVARVDLTKKLKMRNISMTYSDKFISQRSASDTRTGAEASILGSKIKPLTNSEIDDICN